MFQRIRIQADLLIAAAIVLLFALILFTLHNPTSLDDGLRHFTMAQAMREQGIMSMPGWSGFLSQGYLHHIPVDPWFLSDVLLIPFTHLPIAKGLQLFIVLNLALLVGVSLRLFRSFKLSTVERCFFLLLLIFGDAQFLGRFLLGRPYSLITIVSIAVVLCILKRKWLILAIILALSVLLSQLFVFPFFLCACAILASLISRKYSDTLTISAASLIGLIAGLFLHPYSFLYISYLITAFFQIPFLKSIGLSREMQSGVTDVACVGVLILIASASFLAIALQKKKRIIFNNHPDILFLGIASLFLAAAFFFWVRAIDLLWPLLVILTARLYVLDRTSVTDLLKHLRPKNNHLLQFIQYIAIGLCFVQVMSLPYVLVRDDKTHSLEPYEILSRIPQQSRVLNFDWDKFSIYMSIRPDLHYATGIDRAFTYFSDPEVADAIHRLEKQSPGKPLENASELLEMILHEYPTEYVIASQKKFHSLIELMKQKQFTLFAENETIAIFQTQPDFSGGSDY